MFENVNTGFALLFDENRLIEKSYTDLKPWLEGLQMS